MRWWWNLIWLHFHFTQSHRSDDDDENDKPQHQYYYVKQKFVASYEAILPISTSANREDINSEECFEFICVPTIDESGSIDYAEEGDPKIVRRCPTPKCPQGYMIRLQIQKDRNQCAKYVRYDIFSIEKFTRKKIFFICSFCVKIWNSILCFVSLFSLCFFHFTRWWYWLH